MTTRPRKRRARTARARSRHGASKRPPFPPGSMRSSQPPGRMRWNDRFDMGKLGTHLDPNLRHKGKAVNWSPNRYRRDLSISRWGMDRGKRFGTGRGRPAGAGKRRGIRPRRDSKGRFR